jgi:hypothetical protein
MTVKIVSRLEWGAKPWNGTPSAVPLSLRGEFFVHYDGASHINYTGVQVPRAIERTHLNQGWSGVGYNFVIDQKGTIYEGRGWGLQGAHCPNHNVSGIGVQIAIGGDQEPSAAALAACRALYEEACRKTGRTLAKKGHRDGLATKCPGDKLYAWVKAGMPAGDYEPAPNPGGGSGGGPAPVSRYKVTINGLQYGYGAHGAHVTAVGKALVKRGFGKHYVSGPSEQWSDADTKNYADFQKSLGFSGKGADGVPGEGSLKQLLGKLPGKVKLKAPSFPGREKFVLGAKNSYARQLQTWLHEGDWGPDYTVGPSDTMTQKDLEKVRALQRHYLSDLGPADGGVGPKTWQFAFEVAHGLRRK